jgi:hypothetical protein
MHVSLLFKKCGPETAKAGEMVLRIQNLEKKTLTHKTENKELSHKIEVLRY